MQDQTFTLDDSFVVHRPVNTTKSSLPATVQGAAIPAGATPLVTTGNDGRLEVQVPRGALDFAHAALADGSAPVGQLLLQIHQISGHYIEADSILGTYQLQVVDSQGHVVQGVQLMHPVTIVYHYQTWEMTDLNINPSEVHLAWTTPLAALQKTAQTTRTTAQLTQQTAGLVIPMTNNGQTHTLTAQTTVLAGIMTASAQPEINAPAKPDLFETSGNSGQYSYSYPLAVAPGPAGFTPQLALSYSSQSTNGRSSRRSPAGDEGEGFSLSLGSISSAQYPSSSTGGATTWYFLNGIDGVSDRLIPSTTANFYETQHLSHLLIQWTGSCWAVWGLDGSYSQLGCTSDSVRQGVLGAYEWDLNETLSMLPANSPNQASLMQVSYLQDLNGSTTRDSQIKQITYGYATESGGLSFTHVAGMVDFHYHMPSVPSGQSGFAVAYGTNSNCASSPPSSTTLRCDDTMPFGSFPSPDVMSTMSLDSVTSYVGSDSANQPAYQYSFAYQDQPFTTYYDPYTFLQQGAAGEHLLTQITPTVYLQGTAHQRKSVVLSYANALRDGYNDPLQKAINGTTPFSGQTFWSYLTRYQDLNAGVGATISYQTANGNMHGTPYITDSQGNVLDDRFDPFYCATQANNPDPSKRCSAYGDEEDLSWGIQVVTQIAALGTDSSGNTTVATTHYHYALTAIPASNSPVGCNPITGSGVPAQEASCVADNWAPGYNGTPTQQKDGDWADYYHAEYRGFNVVYTTSAANNLTVDDYFSTEGWWFAPSDGLVYNGGQLYREEVYQGNSANPQALLRETDHFYTGVPGSPYSGINTCNGLVNPVYFPCVQASLETKTTFFEGQGSSPNAPWVDTKFTYDDINPSTGYAYSGYHNLLQEVISSSNAPTITKKWTYATTNQTINGWVYYNVDKVSHSEIDDASGHVFQCQDTAYDEGATGPTPDTGLATTTTSYSTCGNTSTALKSYTAYDQSGKVVASVDPLAVANPSLYSSKGCTLSTAPASLSASWTAGRYTSCATYDTTHTAVLPVSSQNALGQGGSVSYDYTSGAMPTSTVDANGQTSSYSVGYDGSGNETVNVKAPGESGSYTTRQNENGQCSTNSTLPCYEIDSNTSLYSSAISRTFYDAQGRAVETRTLGPTPGDDTVVMTVYNDQNNSTWQSVPFQVADGAGWLDPTTAKDINNNTPAGTATFMDALGRTFGVQDPNFGSAQEPGITCYLPTGTWTLTSCVYIGAAVQAQGDSTYYAYQQAYDANGHMSVTFTDALGRTRYVQSYSQPGSMNGNITHQQAMQYNALGKPTSVAVTDEQPQSGESTTIVTTTATYDDLGRLLTMNDPDQGTFSYTYDADSRIIATTQTSGSNTRTIGINYDILGRPGCEQTAAPIINATGACSAGDPLVQNTYDTTFLGTQGSTDFPIGRLTQSVATTYFPDSTSATVTQQVQTDQRGRGITSNLQLSLPSSWGVTTALPSYQVIQDYNDANQPTRTQAAPSNQPGYIHTFSYDSTTGQLSGVLMSNGLPLATLGYNAQGLISDINYMSTTQTALATEHFTYDGDLRQASVTASWQGGSGSSGTIFSDSRSYDPAGNVISRSTMQGAVPGVSNSGGSETQNFCYDEQNRLIWSGNGGTQPGVGNGTCGAGTLSNTLNGAGYTAPFTYTNLGQIWQGPLNGQGAAQQYLYCNSAPHQLSGLYPVGTTCANKSSATAVYSANYDPWGNETSRTYSGTTATLSYDTLNRMVQWSAGSNKESSVYDASGNRVLTRSTSGSTTSLTAYAFGLEEHTYNGSGNPLSSTYYYTLAGRLIAQKVNTANPTILLTDAQGSVLASISRDAGSGHVLGNQVYGPYGNQRYTQGTMNTTKGYTGQFHDSVSGLDYYNARYYDPVAGVFTSPDSVQGNAQGADPYSYVGGNPETATDPTGQFACSGDPCTRPPKGGGTCSDGSKPPCNTGNVGNTDNSCIYHGKPCSATNNDCIGTVWNGSGCVAKPDHSQQKRDARDKKLLLEVIAGAGLVALGALITILADIYAAIEGFHDGNLVAIITAIADGIGVFSDAISAISIVNQGAASVAYTIKAVLGGLLAVANGALGAYNLVMSGWSWAKGILQPVLKFIGITIQGAPGALFKLADELFGKSIINGARLVGHGYMALGNAALANASGQEAMNIDGWCAQYGQDQAACTVS